MKNLEEVLSPYLFRPENDVASLTIRDLWLHHEVEILGLIHQGLVSLRVLPISPGDGGNRPLTWRMQDGPRY